LKRFWTSAEVRSEGAGFAIAQDGRPVRTPARAALIVPSQALADAIAEEWSAQDETIDPRAMPLTGLANAAIDRVEADPAGFARSIASFGESDLLYYRADHPQKLLDRQREAWDPLLAWARRRFDVDFVIGTGIVHLPQPENTVARLRHAVAALKPFELAALSPLVTIGGSLIAGLAVLERHVSADDAWQAVTVDDRFQLEEWGADEEAEAALDNRRGEFFAAARFLTLLD
jgi:chaperone required for assembly of F1-ATPase